MDAKTIILLILAGVGGLMLLGCAGLMLLIAPAMQQARNAARMTQSKNNLNDIGLALHNYHDNHRVFPPGGVCAEDRTPQHGWQTMLLPFVDQAPLYNSIDFNRPWNDPVNSLKFNTVIATYLNPAETTQQASGGAASHYSANKHVLYENSSITVRDVADGTSNTMLAGEVATGYKAWGDPANFRDPAAGILSDGQTFGGPGNPKQCSILMMDGSARTISSSVSPAVMRAIATPNGGEQVPPF